MTEQINLPEELNISLASESRDFAVKGRRAKPIGSSLSQIIFGLVWLGFILFFISFFFDSFSLGGFKQIISEINDANEGSAQKPGIFIVILMSVFVLIGLYMLFGGVFSLLKRGGYFVGTPTRFTSRLRTHPVSLMLDCVICLQVLFQYHHSQRRGLNQTADKSYEHYMAR